MGPGRLALLLALLAAGHDARAGPDEASVTLAVRPVGASVHLDGVWVQDVKEEPAVLDRIPPGRHELVVMAPGHQTLVRHLNLGAGEAIPLAIILQERAHTQAAPAGGLEPMPDQAGSLRIGLFNTLTFGWAQVYVDDDELGTIPHAFEHVEPGDHTLRLTHPELPTVELQVTVASGWVTVLNVDLETGDHTLRQLPRQLPRR